MTGHIPSPSSRRIEHLTEAELQDVAGVLCEAFRFYPAMGYFLGSANPGYDERLERLIRYFVAVRFLRHEPVLGIRDGGTLAAAAIVTKPGDRPHPAGVRPLREALWGELGAESRSRYEAFGEIVGQFIVNEPHYHLNMIGVREANRGFGLARRLLMGVHDISFRDPDSTGVTLSTETPENVALYEHFGYRLLGHGTVSDDLETWVFYRPDEVSTARG